MTDTLLNRYNDVVNEYLKVFCQKQEMDYQDAKKSWVADNVGGVCLVGDYYLDFSDIKCDVDKDAPKGEIFEWYEYDVLMRECGLNTINYRSWLKGAPRYSREELDAIYEKQEEIEKAREGLMRLCDEYKLRHRQ